MHIVHKWGKWEIEKWEAFHRTHGKFIKDVQVRKCTKCGKVQRDHMF